MSLGLKQVLKRVPFARATAGAAKRFLQWGDFVKDYRAFERLYGRAGAGGRERFELSWRDRYPCLGEKTPGTPFDRHYVYHPAWAARILAANRPEAHVDISSSLHFASLVSAFIPVHFYDYRPADLHLSGLRCEKGDLMHLPFADRSVASLSCMHVVEHIGLGRYGDPLDPEGDLKAMKELQRVLAPGGTLLFVTPIGQPRLQFNAHRIYSYDQIVGYFPELELAEFTLIPESFADGPPIRGASRERTDRERYGCGCFWFRRPA